MYNEASRYCILHQRTVILAIRVNVLVRLVQLSQLLQFWQYLSLQLSQLLHMRSATLFSYSCHTVFFFKYWQCHSLQLSEYVYTASTAVLNLDSISTQSCHSCCSPCYTLGSGRISLLTSISWSGRSLVSGRNTA